jgi:hypothetical protein
VHAGCFELFGTERVRVAQATDWRFLNELKKELNA